MFDESYYKKYYEDERTRVSNQASTRRLVRFVVSYLDHICISLDTALDVGCGLGWWQRTLCREGIRYHGLEYSEYMAERMGWEFGSILHESQREADLVICQGVLGYISDNDLPRAISNLADWTGKALYLSVACREDIGESINLEKSDESMIFRPVQEYLDAMQGKFIGIGGGLFLPYKDRSRMTSLEKTVE